MSRITVWANASAAVKLHQLSDAADTIVGYETVSFEDGVETVETENGPVVQPRVTKTQVPLYGQMPYEDQIAHLATLAFLEGYTCVQSDFMGDEPDGDPAFWRWDGQGIVAVVPVPENITPR